MVFWIPSKHPHNRKRTKNSADDRLASLIEKSIQSRDRIQLEIHENMSNQYEDKHFCLSLYKELKNVPGHKRLSTKIQILQVIQNGQTIPAPIPALITAHIPAHIPAPVCSTSHYTVPDSLFWRDQN